MSWLDEAKARCDAATEGPWGLVGTLIDGVVDEVHGFRKMDDAIFLVAARSDLPRALKFVEWVWSYGRHYHGCAKWKRIPNHAPFLDSNEDCTCGLSDLLREIEG